MKLFIFLVATLFISATFGLKCGKHEIVVECSGCEADCNNLQKVCPLVCNGIKACQCQTNFARDLTTKKCVPISQCKKPKAKREVNPCATMKCPPGEVCKVVQVMCFRAPCPPLGQCTPKKLTLPRVDQA
uniref:TIL domain-containing protein n=1 Tax=Panagrolaimus sp. JU765 TaxID=591449 RepID=A0AC34PZ69_9BILA